MTAARSKPRKSVKALRSRPPLPHFVAPCLAKLTDAPPEGDGWVHEIKFDGYRLQVAVAADAVKIYTRSGLDWTARFPRIAAAARRLPVTSALIDGEAIVMDDNGASSFSDLVAALSDGRDASIVLMAFDLLNVNGEDIRRLPLTERKELLATLVSPRGKNPVIRYSEHVVGNGETMFAEVRKLHLEGVVSKRIDKPYTSGRRGDWLKAKCVNTDEFVIVGYVESTAVKRAIGSLVLATFESGKLAYAGRVGTGFSASTARMLWAKLQPFRREASPFAAPLSRLQTEGVNWVEPKLVAEVGYRAITADGILRHASFEGLREDKPARQVHQPKRMAKGS